MKILIDRNIELNARTHRSMLVAKTVQWGGDNITADVLERVRHAPQTNDGFRGEQLPYLATICLMAKDGKVQFYTSHELMMERMRQRGRNEGYVGLNLLKDIHFKHAECPVDRVIVLDPFLGSIGTTEEEQMQFFRSINNPRFIEIRHAVGDAHVDDAFHLWTTEENNLDAFLTMDKKFWRIVNQKKQQIKSPAAVLTPKELCDILKVAPTNIDKIADENPPFC